MSHPAQRFAEQEARRLLSQLSESQAQRLASDPAALKEFLEEARFQRIAGSLVGSFQTRGMGGPMAGRGFGPGMLGDPGMAGEVLTTLITTALLYGIGYVTKRVRGGRCECLVPPRNNPCGEKLTWGTDGEGYMKCLKGHRTQTQFRDE